MESNVGIGILIDIGMQYLGLIKRGEKITQSTDCRIARTFGRKARGHTFHRGPDMNHVNNLLLALTHHEGTSSGHNLYQTFLRQ